jgi:hypothetical protein
VSWGEGRFEIRDELQVLVPVETGPRVDAEANLLIEKLLDLGAENASWTIRDPSSEERGEIVLRLGALDVVGESPEA